MAIQSPFGPIGGTGATGIPPGGLTGQIIVKQSDVDGDYLWQYNIAGGLPPGGTTGQLLAKASNVDGDATWESVPQFLPVPDEFDDLTAYIYMGWISLNGTWKIRRRDKTTLLTTEAGLSNNATVPDLTTAWPLRATLIYS